MNRKKIFRWIKVIILIYCLFGLAIYYLQDRFLFHPVALPASHKYQFSFVHREVNLPVNATSNINIIQFETTQAIKGVVLYFHGNRKNISRYAGFAENFTKKGYEVWMIDYPGFGKSTGEFTEQKLYDWALHLYKLARTRFSPDSIIIYGKSMGTGIASQLASIRDTKRLILETPYYDLPSAVGQYLPIYPVNRMIHYKLPTNQYLPKVTAPITILHGTNDWVIFPSNARKLKKFLKPNDEFVLVQGASHNDLYKYPLVIKKLDSILSY